jgi:RES domain-containing protein
MKLFRITSPNHAYDLSGTGARLYGGRWNSPGQAVVYTSGTISLAMLETMANAEPEWLKKPFSLNIIKIPDNLHIEKLQEVDLSPDWKNYPFAPSTPEKGDRWLQSRLTPVLQVPSAVNPFEYNYLLNPAHQDFNGIIVEEVKEIRFDLRLV